MPTLPVDAFIDALITAFSAITAGSTYGTTVRWAGRASSHPTDPGSDGDGERPAVRVSSRRALIRDGSAESTARYTHTVRVHCYPELPDATETYDELQSRMFHDVMAAAMGIDWVGLGAYFESAEMTQLDDELGELVDDGFLILFFVVFEVLEATPATLYDA